MGSRRSAISRVMRASVLAGGSAGNGRLAGGGALAADDAQAADKRQPVGVEVALEGGLVHQPADGVVDQQVRPDLLGDHLGGAGAQHQLGAALVGLELIQRGLELPPLLYRAASSAAGAAAGSKIVVSSWIGPGC
jgi:hypothetical protein